MHIRTQLVLLRVYVDQAEEKMGQKMKLSGVEVFCPIFS